MSCRPWHLIVGALLVSFATGASSAAAAPRPDDQRYRLVLLGRFGVGGSMKLSFTDPELQRRYDDITGALRPDATLGFDLRFEKPVHRYVAVGAVVGNYWVDSFPGRLRPDRGDYGLDVSAFFKPRYQFPAGPRTAEVYLGVQFGGSMLISSVLPGTKDPSGGWNVAVMPGIQVFVSDLAALVLEIGYQYNWFQISTDGVGTFKLNQANFRLGVAFAF